MLENVRNLRVREPARLPPYGLSCTTFTTYTDNNCEYSQDKTHVQASFGCLVYDKVQIRPSWPPRPKNLGHIIVIITDPAHIALTRTLYLSTQCVLVRSTKHVASFTDRSGTWLRVQELANFGSRRKYLFIKQHGPEACPSCLGVPARTVFLRLLKEFPIIDTKGVDRANAPLVITQTRSIFGLTGHVVPAQ